jgi:hypothetical protein
MSIYSEPVPGKCGEKGEWAQLRYANHVPHWLSWKGAAVVIGPVAVAHEGMWPTYDNKVEFEDPALMICGRLSLQTGQVEDWPRRGLTVDYPLIYDESLRAFTELINDTNEPVMHVWVDFENAGFIRAHRGNVPFVGLDGTRSEVPSGTL